MKKAIMFLSVLMLMLALCSCGKDADPVVTYSPAEVTQAPSEEVTQTPSEEATQTPTQAATKATAKPTTKPAPKPTTCNHSYKDATCTAPKTCTKCGATQGSAKGHSWESATCTDPKICSVCGKTEGSANGHKWQAATCTTPKTCSVCGETSGSAGSHSWKEATCTEPKTCTVCGESSGSAGGHNWEDATCTTPMTCSVCGTTSGNPSRHDWEDATCTEPKTCPDCGATEGEAKGHEYSSYSGKCSNYKCNAVDPIIDEMLAKCTLELPALPETLNYYGYNQKLQTAVQVTAITYEFEYDYDDGTIGLTARFSGTKTYDYNGSGQSSSCKISWKLYDPNGNVVKGSTFYSPSVAKGESFSNKEETLLYSWDNMEPGAYKLVLLNTN